MARPAQPQNRSPYSCNKACVSAARSAEGGAAEIWRRESEGGLCCEDDLTAVVLVREHELGPGGLQLYVGAAQEVIHAHFIRRHLVTERRGAAAFVGIAG